MKPTNGKLIEKKLSLQMDDVNKTDQNTSVVVQQMFAQSTITNTDKQMPEVQSQPTNEDLKLKCKLILSHWLEHFKNSKPQNMRSLIQALIDSRITTKLFLQYLQPMLSSPPSPDFITFLNVSLPLVQNALIAQEFSLEGISAPSWNCNPMSGVRQTPSVANYNSLIQKAPTVPRAFQDLKLQGLHFFKSLTMSSKNSNKQVVVTLVKELLYGKITAPAFCNNYELVNQVKLASGSIDLLHRSLQLLRNALVTKEITFEDLCPIQVTPVQSGAQFQLRTPHSQYRPILFNSQNHLQGTSYPINNTPMKFNHHPQVAGPNAVRAITSVPCTTVTSTTTQLRSTVGCNNSPIAAPSIISGTSPKNKMPKNINAKILNSTIMTSVCHPTTTQLQSTVKCNNSPLSAPSIISGTSPKNNKPKTINAKISNLPTITSVPCTAVYASTSTQLQSTVERNNFPETAPSILSGTLRKNNMPKAVYNELSTSRADIPPGRTYDTFQQNIKSGISNVLLKPPEPLIEEYLLNISCLNKRIKSKLATKGLEIYDDKVAELISHAIERKLRNMLQDLTSLVEKRIKLARHNFQIVFETNMSSQLKFLEDLHNAQHNKGATNEKKKKKPKREKLFNPQALFNPADLFNPKALDKPEELLNPEKDNPKELFKSEKKFNPKKLLHPDMEKDQTKESNKIEPNEGTRPCKKRKTHDDEDSSTNQPRNLNKKKIVIMQDLQTLFKGEKDMSAGNNILHLSYFKYPKL